MKWGATLVEAMNAAAHLWPDRIALRFRDAELTYRELHSRADSLAVELRSQGVKAESIVGIAMERSLDLIIALLATWKAGGAYLPLDPDYPTDRLRFMIGDSDAQLVLTQQHLPEFPRGVTVETLRQLAEGKGLGDAVQSPRARDLAYVIYTSGSTGRPKGAMLEHRSIANRIEWMQAAFPLGESDVVLQKTPTSFDVSVWELFWSHCVGAQMELAEPGGHRDDVYLADLIASRGVTTCHFVPSMLVAFLDAPNVGKCAQTLRRVICSGEALPVALTRRFRDRLPGVELHNLYGPTEAAVDVTHWPVDFDADVVPIGKAITGVTLNIVDPDALERVEEGAEGELWIGGVQVGRGYLNRPELSAEKFIADPFRPGGRIYRTGDRVRRLPSGDIEFLGRFDHQVKIRGFRIELGEIEAKLQEHEAVREATVVAKDGQLIAYATPEGGPEPAAESVEIWGDVFDATYVENEAEDFDLSGWNSSYTGTAIPEATMRMWLDGTLERLRSFGAKRVLELGCGTGMLMFGLAEGLDRYVGLDLSSRGVAALQRKVARRGWEHVELRAGGAHAIAEFADDEFDLVIVNSVLQFFPGPRYLRDIIDHGARVVRDGGHLFFGDVRSLPHLEAFHRSVETFRLGDADPAVLPTRIAESMASEEELLVDPAFFHASGEAFGGFECLWRRGRSDDEMTRFRYDAILHVGARDNPTPPDARAWSGQLDDALVEPHVVVKGIPNARIAEQGVEPDALLEQASRAGWVARVTPRADPESMDLYLDQEGSPRCLIRPAPKADRAREAQWMTNPRRGHAARALRRQWRPHLGDSLPAYMVPHALVVLPAMPLTPSGKVDRKLLPAPDFSRRSEDAVRPRSEVEAAIAELWTAALGVDVGVHDNFFDLGGDSIVALQIAAKAREAGLGLTPALLFRVHTIAELAEQIGEHGIDAEQGRVSGEHTLTAMQRWTFDHTPEHLARSLMLAHVRSSEPVETEALRRAVETLVEHHDALRLSFDGERASYDEGGIEVVEGAPHVDGIDLKKGPVGRLFVEDEGRTLTLGIHPLIMDGFSTRLLVEDLQRALDGQALPPKSTSFQSAAAQLAEYAGREAQSQQEYWREVSAKSTSMTLSGSNREHDAEVVHRTLDAETTRAFFVGVPRDLDVAIDDALLTSVAAGLHAWTERSHFVLDTESHGREPLFDDVDLSRTVGVFSALYPVALHWEGTTLDSLRRIQKTRDALMDTGIGYGLLHYVEPTPGIADAARRQVLFNFLGRYEDGGALRMVAGATGLRDPDEPRSHPLIIEAMVTEGQLHIHWSYSREMFDVRDIERAADAQMNALRELCDPPQQAARFAACPLDDATLERVSAGAELEDVYPTAPLQDGMLLHTALNPQSGIYRVQIGGRIDGPLDEERLRRAWEGLCAAHPILRTRFVVEDVATPTQLVVAGATPGLEIAEWSDSWVDSVRQQRSTYGMDASGLTHLRATRGSDSFHVAWDFHHALLDGWSMMDLLEELVSRYQDPDIALPARPPYRRYVQWARAHTELPKAFRSMLAGASSTKLPTDASSEAPPRKTMLRVDPAPLRELARRERVTMNTVLQSIWALLLMHWSGTEDVVFGAVVPGRPPSLPGAERIIGLLMNTLPIRSRPSDEPLGDWLRAEQQTLVGLRDHEHVPLAELQKLANLATGEKLVTSVISVQGYLRGAASLEGWAEGIGLNDLWFEDWNDLPLSLAAEVGDELRLTVKTSSAFSDAAAARLNDDLGSALRLVSSAKRARDVLEGLTEAARTRRKKGAMTSSGPKRRGPKRSGPRSGPRGSRRAVSADPREWVKLTRLEGLDRIPCVVTPTREVDLPTWAEQQSEWIEELLHEHRALLFRGFGVNDAGAFERFVAATSKGDPLEYRDRTTPRTSKRTGVYTSTIHPADQTIHLHNEGTYWTRWAQKLYFSCSVAAETGGATPLADVRRVYERIDPTIRKAFEDREMMLVRNYNDGFGLPWEEVFQTEDRSEVEAYCRANDIELEWKDGGRLRTRSRRPAVRRHPRTGELVWFNHVAFFHWTSLEEGMRDALLAELGEDGLPYNTFYGDGGSIEPGTVRHLRDAYAAELIAFPWERGDVTLLDNMAVAHGRQPYSGDREVLVAMTEPVGDDDLPPLES